MAPAALGRVLVSADALKARVAELGRAIARDYAGASPVLVGVLQGAVPFLADLMRELPLDLTVDFLRASSYGSGTNSSGAVRLLSDLTVDIKGRPVLLVDDIVDTGLTLAVLKRTLEARGPLSVRTCVEVKVGKAPEEECHLHTGLPQTIAGDVEPPGTPGASRRRQDNPLDHLGKEIGKTLKKIFRF